MASLHELYLDALVSARTTLGNEVKQVYLQTGQLVESDSLIHAFEIEPRQVAFRTTVFDIQVRRVSNLPPIESREILLRLIVSLHKRVNNLTESRSYSELCYTLGCHLERTLDVAERWRKLAMHRRIDELPYYGLEDRPSCKICGGIVATGSGWQPDAGSAPSVALAPEVQAANAAADYRPDVHHECKRYAIHVMLPLLRAQRERAAKQVAKELDK